MRLRILIAGMPGFPVSIQSRTGLKKTQDDGPVRYRNKMPQSGNFQSGTGMRCRTPMPTPVQYIWGKRRQIFHPCMYIRHQHAAEVTTSVPECHVNGI
jgi:hypothetical protein